MRIERIPPGPADLIEFYEQALARLGAVCERTWHDRLEVLAEGRAATVWNDDGALHAGELHFVASDATAARDAASEVFAGCPLTFRLAELLRPSPLPLERFFLPKTPGLKPPDPAVTEKLWRAQFPDTTHWRMCSAFAPDFHFSLAILARCEIQAIDQHWSLHRIAVSLPDGDLDEDLERQLGFTLTSEQAPQDIPWPQPDPGQWAELVRLAIEQELAGDLARVRERQENSLRRDLERIDAYFEAYEQELTRRSARSANSQTRMKATERLAAAKAEHARRRADQVARHEILIRPRLDGLILIGETAWKAQVAVHRSHHSSEVISATFTPRSRRWRTMQMPGR